MNAWIALALGLPAFASLSFAMLRHHEQAWNREPDQTTSRLWRVVGIALLALSLWVCMQRWNLSIAIAAWFGILTIAAIVTGLFITYAPRKLPLLAGLSGLAGMAIWVVR